ncbi:hypothetical protein D3C87_1179940 [compost metagenome]
MNSTDLVAISTNDSFIKRCQGLSADFAFSFAQFETADTFFGGADEAERVRCFILDCTKFTNIHEAAGTIQVARQVMDRSFIVCVLDSRVKPEDMEMLKKSGSNLVMLDSEFSTNSKLEFVSSQIIKSAFLPIKPVDFVENSTAQCAFYMLMPKNQKYLRIYKPGQNISAEFIKKFITTPELYIHRSDVESWSGYIGAFHASSKEDSAARACRGRFLKLQQAFLDLVLVISDQTSSSSFGGGKELFENCQKFTAELLESLAEVKYPWDIINNSSIGDFGSVERGTAIAAYAGMLSRAAQIGNPQKIMLGALFADIGLILLSPRTTKKVRLDQMQNFNAEEKMEFEKHPIFSLNQMLSKRLQLDEDIKDMILYSHERMDQKGFPSRPGPNKIREDSMIVRLAQEVDQALMLRMGKERVEFLQEFESFLDQKIKNIDGYTLAMLFKLRALFKAA